MRLRAVEADQGEGASVAVDPATMAPFPLAPSHMKKPTVPTATVTPTVANAVG